MPCVTFFHLQMLTSAWWEMEAVVTGASIPTVATCAPVSMDTSSMKMTSTAAMVSAVQPVYSTVTRGPKTFGLIREVAGLNWRS